MAEIRVLDKHTAELIAAGEVVERPASRGQGTAGKCHRCRGDRRSPSRRPAAALPNCRLLITAPASKQNISITAFIRHATSKIATADDLEAYPYPGIPRRGLGVHRQRGQSGSADPYRNGRVCLPVPHQRREQSRALSRRARPVGTTITVQDLFYNTPARMKFLKKDTSEGNYVSRCCTQLALSHPEVGVPLCAGRQAAVLRPPATETCAVRSTRCWAASFARDLLPVDGGSELYTVARPGHAATGAAAPAAVPSISSSTDAMSRTAR